MLRWMVAVGAVLVLAAPAEAKPPLPEPGEGPDPRGLTISGRGLAAVAAPERLSDETIRAAVAAARPAALARAVVDGRRRATAVAQAAGLTLGDLAAVREVTDGWWGPVDEERFCFRPRRARPQRCHVPQRATATVQLTFATAETEAAGEPARTLTADGVGRSAVQPAERREEAAIRRALDAAAAAADVGAVAPARADATALAAASARTLGPLVSIAEDRLSPHAWPSAAMARLGTFGPGRFCGMVRRAVTRRDPRTNRRRVVRRVRERRCHFPSTVTTRLRVTFATS